MPKLRQVLFVEIRLSEEEYLSLLALHTVAWSPSAHHSPRAWAWEVTRTGLQRQRENRAHLTKEVC